MAFGAWLLIAYYFAGTWLTVSGHVVVLPLWLLAGVPVVSAVSLWLRVAHRRRVWGIGAAIALASGGICLTGLTAGKHTQPPLVRFKPENWAVADPVAPFAEAHGGGTYGWRWVHSDEHWRRALVVQPPCRLAGRATVRGQEPPQFFLATAKQSVGTVDPPLRVHCAIVDADGRTVRRQSQVLPVSTTRGAFGPWEGLTVDVSGGVGPGVEVVFEVEPAGSVPPSDLLPALAIAPSPPTPPAAPAGANCVFILVDALRPDRLHCYGYPRDTSPRIDALAKEGVLFEQVVSACSWTVPSVASLFTGTYVSTHGMTKYRIPGRLSLPTLAEQLREAGVRTAAVSSNSLVTPAGGFGAGFDEFVGIDSNEMGGRAADAPRAAWVTDHAITVLRRIHEQQFFLYLHYMDPHAPYTPPAEWDRFGRGDHERYLAEIRYCDDRIGRLLDELDALGCAENTLVVFTADHGEAFSEHGTTHHGNSVHREEVHVPLILRYPGPVPRGRRVGTRVRSIDIHTTVAELMGLSVPRHVEGESLLALLDGVRPADDRTCFSELYPWQHLGRLPQAALYQGNRKLIVWLEADRRALYHTKRDPDERNNLAADEPDRVASMERSIRRFLKMRENARPADRPPTEAERARLRGLGYLDAGAR